MFQIGDFVKSTIGIPEQCSIGIVIGIRKRLSKFVSDHYYIKWIHVNPLSDNSNPCFVNPRYYWFEEELEEYPPTVLEKRRNKKCQK